jgi:hypothetical protein
MAVLLPRPVAVEMIVMVIPHAAFVGWLAASHRAMRSQRATELARLRELRDKPTPTQ